MKLWNALRLGTVGTLGTLSALGAAGCTIMADLDSYVSADELGCDLRLHVIEFSPHLGDPVYFQGVTRDTNELRAMAIIDPLVLADRRFVMPNAIGQGEHALNFWADVDNDGVVQTSPFAGDDHSWRFEDACNFETNCASGEADCFSHVAPFINIENPVEMGNALQLELTGLPPTAGFIEIHLIERDVSANLRRVVGLYRKDDAGGGPTFSMKLGGLVFPGRRYSVDVLVDLNCDNVIDPTTEMFTVTESDGSAYANVVRLNLTTADAAIHLPVEVGPDPEHPEQLVSPLPTALFCSPVIVP